MGNSEEDEIRRLQQLRDRQLAESDPRLRQRTYTQTYRRQVSARKKMTLSGEIGMFSNKLKGGIIGGVLGFAAWIILSILVTGGWVTYAGIAAVVVFIGFGVLVGASFDWRNNLRDF